MRRGLNVGFLLPGAVVAVVAIGVGTAYGHFASAGTGAGAGAAAGGLVALTTTATTPSGALLYPGGPDVPLTVRVHNPNARPVEVTAIAANGTPTAGGTCTTTAVTLVAPNGGLPFTVAAGATTTFSLAGAVRMGTGASNGCQGATFTVPVILTGRNT